LTEWHYLFYNILIFILCFILWRCYTIASGGGNCGLGFGCYGVGGLPKVHKAWHKLSTVLLLCRVVFFDTI